MSGFSIKAKAEIEKIDIDKGKGDDFAAFKAAESLGKHFGKHIKPFAAKNPYKKIETPAKAA